MKFIVRLCSAFCVVLLGACAAVLPPAPSPEAVGVSSARLDQMASSIRAGIEKGEIPGAVVLIARHGKVAYFESFGYRDREAKSPMGRDSIFRIASMTKPITSVAAMMLVEEGKLSLQAPVSRYLPEFRDAKVGVETKDASGNAQLGLQSPAREMTVLDLMRHTSGMTYGFTGKSLVRDQYTKANLSGAQSNAEFVSRLASAPLQNQPGAVWDYSVSTDVLGRVVEVISGKELGQFFAERIFVPLGMTDTTFWVGDTARHNRIAEAQAGADGKRPPMADPTKKSREGGGGALVSTAADYARFCQMLLNGGELGGTRLLSRETIALMTKDHLPPGIKINQFSAAIVDVRPEAGNGFGLGFMMRTADGRSSVNGNVGDYSWPGIFGTYFWIDPKKDLIGIMMIQVPASAGPLRVKYWTQLREMVYTTLVD